MMIVSRRRLFWKIYLTLLMSLVGVAVLMGAFWSLIGENGRPRWGAFPLHVDERLIPGRDSPPAEAAAAMKALGEEMEADVSVYDSDGSLVAAEGRPVAPGAEEESARRAPPRRILRIDLPDGRALLARLRPPPRNPHFRILSIVLIVVFGVALAAFPVTARLTRRLESLRAGVEQWGAGKISLRVDDSGDDEVAVVARSFNAAAGRVEDLLAAQRALLANASHELRSPLARLRMAIELWLARPEPGLQAEIMRNLAESDTLVDEILLASRLDHERSSRPPAAPVDLTAVAAEEAARFDPGVASLAEGRPVEIEGDATLLRRLIRNLVDNAVKHGRPPVTIVVARIGEAARIAVSDRGEGIAAEERERVFEPFYRPAGRSESSGGWGLGLSLVRQIAERHGGRASCEAEPAGGSRFVVELPARAAGGPGPG